MTHLWAESPLRTKVTTANDSKYLVNGGIRREGAVEDGELSLEASRNVVASSSWMDHGSHELDVHNAGKVPRLLQTVEPMHFHHLADNLIGDLRNVSNESTVSKK